MMIKLCLCLAALAAVAQGAETLSRHARMAGGAIVTGSEYSFQVGIRPTRTQAGTTVKLAPCTGVLITGEANPAITGSTANYVLTSATCVESGTSLQLFAGVTRILASSTPIETVTATNAIIHDKFFEGEGQGNLAIIPVTTLAPNGGTITAAKLTAIDDATKGFLATSVKMAGWGYPNKKFNSASPSLRSLSSRVVPNSYCQMWYLAKHDITDDHICTAGAFNKGPCTGDSGAPVVAKINNVDRVIGLATFTPESGCHTAAPGVFTKLGAYLDWITEIALYDPES